MELKRYVQVENGMVYRTRLMAENDEAKSISIEGNNEQFAIYMESKLPDRKSNIAMGNIGKITATADDIFELATPYWFTLDDKLPLELKAVFDYDGNDHLCYEKEQMEWFLEHFTALFAPIYENGKIKSYEKVWERE